MEGHPERPSLLPPKVDDSDVVSFLLQTEIIPLCLRIMETGGELPMTVATFIVEKILADDTGLNYVCHTYDRFATVTRVLDNMVRRRRSVPREEDARRNDLVLTMRRSRRRIRRRGC